MVFTEEQMCQLYDHIKALERFYGLSVNQCGELAHECTSHKKLAIPASWKKARSKKAQHLKTVINKMMKLIDIRWMMKLIDIRWMICIFLNLASSKITNINIVFVLWLDGVPRRNSLTIRTPEATLIAGGQLLGSK